METKKMEITYKDIPLELEYFLRPGNEATLLYLHGGGCSKEDFAEALNREELNQYTLVSFDFPGCGNSPYPPEAKFNVDDLVEITAMVIEQLNLDKIILIGHSMGGLVALLLTIKYPYHIKSLISIEGNLSPDSCNFSRKIIEFGLEEWEQKEFPKLIETLLHSGNKGREEYAKTLKKYSSPRSFHDVCPQLVDYSDNGNLVKKFIDLPIPKILLYGSENRTIKHIDELKREKVAVQEISNSGHFPFHDNPEEYYKDISSFLVSIN